MMTMGNDTEHRQEILLISVGVMMGVVYYGLTDHKSLPTPLSELHSTSLQNWSKVVVKAIQCLPTPN
jgi:hypothetical protein